MTKESALNLNPGENGYRFSEQEIQMICRALEITGKQQTETAGKLWDMGSISVSNDLQKEADGYISLQMEIENEDHSL